MPHDTEDEKTLGIALSVSEERASSPNPITCKRLCKISEHTGRGFMTT